MVSAFALFEEDYGKPRPVPVVLTEHNESPSKEQEEEGPPQIGLFYLEEHCGPGSQSYESCSVGADTNNQVPLPSTLLLFGIGLLGLARARKSKP